MRVSASLYRVVWQARLLSPSECAALRDAPVPWASARVTATEGSTVNGNKRASWKLLPLGSEFTWIFERLAVFLAERATFGFELRELESPLKVQRYRRGDFHGWHADLGAPRGTERKLGITVQLSDSADYIGGDLRFFDPPDHRMSPRDQGCAIAFPSYMPHEVTPVTQGARHSLTAWALGPPFR